MTAQRTTKGRLAQFVGDALFGLGLFLLIACLIAGDGRAQGQAPQPDAMTGGPAGSAPSIALMGEPASAPVALMGLAERSPTGLRQTDADTARTLLAIVFSCLVALNLGFFRHLRRTYTLAR